jgi:hypothetical protein
MNEQEFASKLKPWLDRSAVDVGEFQATKLKAARLRALDAFREPVKILGLVTVTAGTAQALQYRVVPQVLLWLPILALLATLAVKSVGESDMGALDAQLLTQELPPDAYLDQDFRSWLGDLRR